MNKFSANSKNDQRIVVFPTFPCYIQGMRNFSYITPTLDHNLFLISFARPIRIQSKYLDCIVRKRFNDAMLRHYSGTVIIFNVSQIDERNFRVLCLVTPTA